jgi:hypothetical protein
LSFKQEKVKTKKHSNGWLRTRRVSIEDIFLKMFGKCSNDDHSYYNMLNQVYMNQQVKLGLHESTSQIKFTWFNKLNWVHMNQQVKLGSHESTS